MIEQNEIEELILIHFNVTRDELYGKRGKDIYVNPRRTMMYLLRDRLGYTYQDIARLFNCDHSNVMHHVKRMDYLKDMQPIKRKYDLIISTLDFKPVHLTDNDALKRIMASIVWEEKGTTRKNLEKLLQTNLTI